MAWRSWLSRTKEARRTRTEHVEELLKDKGLRARVAPYLETRYQVNLKKTALAGFLSVVGGVVGTYHEPFWKAWKPLVPFIAAKVPEETEAVARYYSEVKAAAGHELHGEPFKGLAAAAAIAGAFAAWHGANRFLDYRYRRKRAVGLVAERLAEEGMTKKDLKKIGALYWRRLRRIESERKAGSLQGPL